MLLAWMETPVEASFSLSAYPDGTVTVQQVYHREGPEGDSRVVQVSVLERRFSRAEDHLILDGGVDLATRNQARSIAQEEVGMTAFHFNRTAGSMAAAASHRAEAYNVAAMRRNQRTVPDASTQATNTARSAGAARSRCAASASFPRLSLPPRSSPRNAPATTIAPSGPTASP